MPDKRAMPAFDKAPADLIERFGAVMAGRPSATLRKMFGYPAAFVNGNLATGLFRSDWFVRLPDTDTAELVSAGGGPLEPMPGRPMRGYTVLPAGVATDPDAAGSWVDRAIAHTASLPPKK
jgi:TfoX N-terminal domain